ncbi:hypothetical protein PILCRDRAFT_4214 [Piloderma croceum F 1598]|uniref:Exocyst complex component Sec10-like alpha-helical bundle domain-containing protein n=1 Tax=Piloderma croceum (strain F 1598) TaxID=765440 RepID=A0A0C3CB86_PILCF|nr:hypothetical protein PILCRDRAFT_4214 [Piloderma croceum F 1598]
MILHKYIKRQIISLSGGFQVIADLNTYYVFIASLKVPQIISDFSHLKMVGHVYIVEDAQLTMPPLPFDAWIGRISRPVFVWHTCFHDRN